MSVVLSESRSEFRPVLPENIPAIMAIEKSAYDFPWTEGLLSGCLKNNNVFHAIFRQEEIIAYGILSCIVDESHILNLCVSPKHQQQGFGRQMLEYLLDIASREKSHTVFLEVRESNGEAQRLYENNGFNQVGERQRYYPGKDGRENAIIYAKVVSGSS